MISIAPMIQWTDRHWRFLFRLISKKTILYTEMTMANTLIYNANNLEKFIGYSPEEEPLVIQLGGNDPTKLSEAGYLCERFGHFHEINLNCGCPSIKAKKCGFGAELMLQPDLVKQILSAMKRKVCHTDITVKCRLGVTNRDSWEELIEFIQNVSDGGIRHVIVHARICHLQGLSPAENRNIPPLNYEWVHQLVTTFPEMKFTLNGGITDFDTAIQHLGTHYNNNTNDNNPSSEDSVIPSAFQNISHGDTTLSRHNVTLKRSYHYMNNDTSINNALFAASNNGSAIKNASTIYHDLQHQLENMTNGPRLSSNKCNIDNIITSGGVHGVMIGREAYHNPFLFAKADYIFFRQQHQRTKNQHVTSTSSSSSVHSIDSYHSTSKLGKMTYCYYDDDDDDGQQRKKHTEETNSNGSNTDEVNHKYVDGKSDDDNGELLLTRRNILTNYLKYAEDCQVNQVFGSSTCNLIKPLHNFFTHLDCNAVYKRTLDNLLKIHAHSSNNKRNNNNKRTTTAAYAFDDINDNDDGNSEDHSSSNIKSNITNSFSDSSAKIKPNSSTTTSLSEIVWSAVNQSVPNHVLDAIIPTR